MHGETPLLEVFPADPEASMGELPEQPLAACVGCANRMLSNWIIGRDAQAPAVADLLVNCGWDMVVISRTTGATEADNVHALLEACCTFGQKQWDPKQWDPSIVAKATSAVADVTLVADVVRVCSQKIVVRLTYRMWLCVHKAKVKWFRIST